MKIRGIATAVCALPRNDMVFRQSEAPPKPVVPELRYFPFRPEAAFADGLFAAGFPTGFPTGLLTGLPPDFLMPGFRGGGAEPPDLGGTARIRHLAPEPIRSSR